MPEPNFEVAAIRPFVPASDFTQSLRFYTDLGFTTRLHGDSLASLQLGAYGFLLQQYDVPGFAGNFMMHMFVHDLDAWWQRIAVLDLGTRYGVRPPTPPAMQPWGLNITYVVDPTGVLWHIAQQPH